MPENTLRAVYQEFCEATASGDKEKLAEIVPELLKQLGMNTSKLAFHLGISDQTVYRWRTLNGPYKNTVPTKEALEKLGELIERTIHKTLDVMVEEPLPDDLPAAYYRAVAGTRRPSTKYFRFLLGIERLLEGVSLSEETCQAILRDYEEARSKES